MGWTTEGSVFESRWDQELFFLHVVQTSTEAHPASYKTRVGLYLRGQSSESVKLTTHLHVPRSRKCMYTSIPSYIFIE